MFYCIAIFYRSLLSMIARNITSQKWFSILMALGSIGVLLIIMVSLASIYINELKLSRMQYNNILAYAQAEWVFEYAMLKKANHREGFQDTMQPTDLDAHMFSGSTDRTRGTTVKYSILSQSRDHTFSLSGSSQIILPLWVGTGSTITGSVSSIDPNNSRHISHIRELTLAIGANPENISWNIIALSGSENIGLSGTGEIHLLTSGLIRRHSEDCYNSSGTKWPCHSVGFGIENGWDTLEYFYDWGSTVADFLGNNAYQNPYLLVFNSGTTETSLHIQTDTPFALPTLSVITEARKANSMQSIEFSEDKSRYYDAVQYGVYNK